MHITSSLVSLCTSRRLGLLAVPPTSSRKKYIVTQTTAHKIQVRRKRVVVTCRLRGSGFSPSVAATRTCRNHAMPRVDRTEQETDAKHKGLPDYGKMTYLQPHVVRVVACILVWMGGATIEI